MAVVHLPDGFLSPPVWASLDVAAGLGLLACVRRLGSRLPEDVVPRMGMLGAFVFAAQMVNVPVAAGTSGHLLGGVLVASVVGPEAATLVMAAVFAVQCLLFQDGGLLALGANVVNMGLSGTIGGYLLLRALLAVVPERARLAAVFVAAWATVVGSAALVSLELAASGTVALAPSLVAMVAVHALIGLVEGAITVAVVGFLETSNRQTLPAGSRLAVAAIAALAATGALIASSAPDGLERVATDLGFAGRATTAWTAPLPDYGIPGLPSPWGGALAGLLGAVAVGGGAWASGRGLAHFHASAEHGHTHATRIERADPRVKLVLAVAVAVVASALPAGGEGVLLPIGVFLVVVAALAEIPPFAVLWRACASLPFAALPALFSPLGLPHAARVGARAYVATLAVVVLVSTTPLPRIVVAARALGVPSVLVETVAVVGRYLGVLRERADAMQASAVARGFGRGPRGEGVRAGGAMLGSLLVRSLDRADRVQQAMAARGWRGATVPLDPPEALPGDVVAAVGGLAVLLALLGAAWAT